MSYQVLARKWRPQNFKQMVGQEHVLKALIHALESQRLHHAYLFTGTRGVGKTTIGRILSKCLSCHQGITAEPCGECGACQNIAEGRYVDLIEIDAASRTKVEDMRELLDNVQYAPSEGRFKIYLIDEVHMLSQSSFNALLKTLEEPPEHVKFLFATTDPQKLPVTILSRCLQFNLKNMSPERIVGHLKHILAEEQVGFDDMALWALARAADGSMRDALSLTDQAIAYGNHELTEQGVTAMLGTVDQKKIYRILDSLIQGDAAQMLREVQALAEFSPNYASVLASISEILHRVAIEQAVPGATDNSMGDQEMVVNYARALCAEDVQLFYQIALVSRQDLAITPDPKSGLEMALLRMVAFQSAPLAAGELSDGLNNSQPPNDLVTPAGSTDSEYVDTAAEHAHTDNVQPDFDNSSAPVDSIAPIDNASFESPLTPSIGDGYEDSKKKTELETLERSQTAAISNQVQPKPDVEDAPNAVVSDLPSNQQTTNTHEEVNSTRAEPEASQDFNQNVKDDLHAIDEPGGTASNEGFNNASNDSQDRSSKLVAEESGYPLENVAAQGWNKLVTQLGLSGMTQNLIMNSVLKEEDSVISVYVEAGHFRLLNASHEKRIIDAVAAHFGEDRKVALINGLQPGQETPMMWRERMKAEMADEAKQTIVADANVKELIAEFDAKLLEDSIESLRQIV